MIINNSTNHDNYTPNTEFNIATDPKTTTYIFHNDIEIIIYNLNITNQTILTPNYLATLPKLNRTEKILHTLFNHYRNDNIQNDLQIHNLYTIA